MTQRQSTDNAPQTADTPETATLGRRRFVQAAGLGLPAILTLRSGGLAAQSITCQDRQGADASQSCLASLGITEVPVDNMTRNPMFDRFENDPDPYFEALSSEAPAAPTLHQRFETDATSAMDYLNSLSSDPFNQ